MFAIHNETGTVVTIALSPGENFMDYIGPLVLGVPVISGNREYDELIAREIPIAPYEPPSVDLAAYAARRRWEIIEATTVDVSGIAVPAAETTRNIALAAYVKAKADPAFTVDPWKIGSGTYVTLTAAQVIVVSDALTAYVQSMFAKNRAIDDAIAAGTITTTAEIDAAYAA